MNVEGEASDSKVLREFYIRRLQITKAKEPQRITYWYINDVNCLGNVLQVEPLISRHLRQGNRTKRILTHETSCAFSLIPTSVSHYYNHIIVIASPRLRVKMWSHCQEHSSALFLSTESMQWTEDWNNEV